MYLQGGVGGGEGGGRGGTTRGVLVCVSEWGARVSNQTEHQRWSITEALGTSGPVCVVGGGGVKQGVR